MLVGALAGCSEEAPDAPLDVGSGGDMTGGADGVSVGGAAGMDVTGDAGATAGGNPTAEGGNAGAPDGGGAGGVADGGSNPGGAGGTGGVDEPAGGGGAGGMGGEGGAATDPDARRLLLRDEGNSSLHYVDLGEPANNYSVSIPAGRDLQLVGSGQVLLGTDNGYELRNIADGSAAGAEPGFPGTQTAHRLHNRNTLLTGINWQGGQGIVLVEVDAAGSVVDTISYAGYGYVRLAREIGDDHFLVAADNQVFEGDRDGNVVWTGNITGHAEPHAWQASPIAGGSVAVASGYGASLQIFTPPATEPVETFTGGDPAANPVFFSGMQVLSSGNIIVANWQGHDDFGDTGLQLLEYDPAGSLAWAWQQDDAFVASLQGVIVLDGLDLDVLHVESPITGQLEPVD